MEKTKKDTVQVGTITKHAAVGAVMGLIATIIITAVIAAAIRAGALPESLGGKYVLVAVIIGSALAGNYCAGKRGVGVVTCGVAAAVAYILLVSIVSLFVAGKSSEAAMGIKVALSAMVGGVFGGVAKLHRKSNKSKVRRKKYNK